MSDNDNNPNDLAVARANNKLVLDMARMLNGRSALEIEEILREVRKLTFMTTIMNTSCAEFKEQEALFELHFGASPEASN